MSYCLWWWTSKVGAPGDPHHSKTCSRTNWTLPPPGDRPYRCTRLTSHDCRH
ncbi:hypothetical protein NFI96_019922 [Prochilodus magdalenae]|nr:hypothetical protein NFI96_019922 [Prochilodus magdalenae]